MSTFIAGTRPSPAASAGRPSVAAVSTLTSARAEFSSTKPEARTDTLAAYNYATVKLHESDLVSLDEAVVSIAGDYVSSTDLPSAISDYIASPQGEAAVALAIGSEAGADTVAGLISDRAAAAVAATLSDAGDASTISITSSLATAVTSGGLTSAVETVMNAGGLVDWYGTRPYFTCDMGTTSSEIVLDVQDRSSGSAVPQVIPSGGTLEVYLPQYWGGRVCVGFVASGPLDSLQATLWAGATGNALTISTTSRSLLSIAAAMPCELTFRRLASSDRIYILRLTNNDAEDVSLTGVSFIPLDWDVTDQGGLFLSTMYSGTSGARVPNSGYEPVLLS